MTKIRISLFIMLTTLLLCSCGTTSIVPITGRKQHLLVSDEQVMSLSNEQYQTYMKSVKPSTNLANTAMVRRVGERLANAVESYLIQHNEASEIKNYKWIFNLVQDKQANAFCMPGGKIVVYEGLLQYAQDEASLAIVLGHEIAHAVARHSAERMSQQLKAQYGAQALDLLLGNASNTTKQISQEVYGLGAQYGVMLPYSRSNESEADYMGLIFAAMAGYNPNVAISFWQRMSKVGSSTPEFMSDHPSDANRISLIQKEMPEALKYYTGNPVLGTFKVTNYLKSKTGKSNK